MKKALVLLLLVAMVAPVFADDALILPNRIIRFRTIPSLAMTSQQFDNDGEKQDLTESIELGALGFQTFTIDSVNVWALSFALEVGVTEQINVAAQWTPGWQFASSSSVTGPGLTSAAFGGAVPQATLDAAEAQGIEGIENAKQTGLNDLFVGAKIQILGGSGFVPNESMRLAASVGAKVPLSVYDPDEAAEDRAAGNEFQSGRVDRDVWGLGFRLHYDYLFSEMFFVNLFSETQIFLPRDLDQGGDVDVEYGYGYQQAFEIDPQFAYPLSDAVRLSGSLPTRYTMTPDLEVGGTTIDDTASQLLTITPQVGAFFTGLPVPIETKLQYSLPVYGVNRAATSALALQINTYLRF
jgi:hypothetical protein